MLDTDEVELYLQVYFVIRDVCACRLCQRPELCGRDGFLRRGKPVSFTAFDLDEVDRVRLFGHYVQLISSIAPVAVQQREAVCRQPFRRCLLALATYILRKPHCCSLLRPPAALAEFRNLPFDDLREVGVFQFVDFGGQ